jgi:hypothetical protein
LGGFAAMKRLYSFFAPNVFYYSILLQAFYRVDMVFDIIWGCSNIDDLDEYEWEGLQ